MGDLLRCSAEDDFFRWEIDYARQLEAERKLCVVVVIHGTTELTDLVCGITLAEKSHKRALDSVGQWGQDLLEYLHVHYVIFFDIDRLDKVAEQIISAL